MKRGSCQGLINMVGCMGQMEFSATIKLITGEEIFAIVTPCEENDKDFLLLYEPVIISTVSTMTGYGYKIEPWLKTADDDIFIIERNRIITLSECRDQELIKYHEKFIRQKNKMSSSNPYEEKLGKDQGYVDTVKEMREKLEKLL
jgi:hypothetical protein